MGLMSFGMSSASCESSDEGFSTSPGRKSSDSFPSKETLKSMCFSPMPVVFPILRTEQSNSPPKSKPHSNYNTNQLSLSEMTFDAAFNHDYGTQGTFVPVNSNKAVDCCLDPVEVSVGPLAARVRDIDVVASCYICYL